MGISPNNDRFKKQHDEAKTLIDQTFMPDILARNRELHARYMAICEATNEKNPMDFNDHINATLLLGNDVMLVALTKKEQELGL
jgi:hypothetical protein